MDHIELEDSLRTAVSSGGAVCLIGAGFSRLAADAQGNPVPSTEELTGEIKHALGIDRSETANLSEIADFAEENSTSLIVLRKLLINRLTVTAPSSAQISIARLPWRALFTTNFDDVLERSRQPSTFVAVTPATDAQKIAPDKTPIYYLHGRALDLLETDKNPSLVISERNYLQLDKRNRDLYAKFYNEIFAARAVLIIGYSIKDLEIAQGILSRSETLKEKTFIICHPSDGKFARSRLEKFGTVLPIGADGLNKILLDLPIAASSKVENFQFLEEVKITLTDEDITSEDFVRLILRGEIDSSKLHKQNNESGENRFYVNRGLAISTILDGSDSFTRRYIISSDFGNGKTVFLKQLAVKAIERGYRVLVVKTQLDEAFHEVDAAVASGQRFMFIMDDVVRYREMAKYVGARATNSISLVCTTRGEQDERAYATLAGELGGAVRHIDLNALADEEIGQWDEILERWGYWEQRIQASPDARKKFLRDECGAENRSIVLALFRNSRIADRIDRIVEFFLRDTRKHLRAFAALLIASLAQRHVTWESLVVWLEIDENSLKLDLSVSDIADLFRGGRSWNAFTSSQLAEFILRNRFLANDRDILVDIYSTIVLKTAASANDARSGIDSRENLKELMKFRFLTRLFGDEQDATILIGTVYRRLSDAPRIRNNPQFWLQFAMSRMAVDDLDTAESYLNTALGLAKERGKDYSPFQILDQKSRLLLRKNTESKKHNHAEIMTAIGDLKDLLSHRDYELIYPFRATPLIVNFLEKHIDSISSDLRIKISNLLEELKDSSKSFQKLPRSQKGETKTLYKSLSDGLLIIRNA
jgi:hypothetical protein